MTTQIPWGDGSGQSITLTYTGTSGVQTVTLTSPPLNGFEDRSKTLTFAVEAGQTRVERTLLVKQTSLELIVVTDSGVATTDNNVAGGDLNT